MTIICRKCHIEKESTEYHKNKNLKTGFATMCKICANEYNNSVRNPNYGKEYYAKNKVTIKKASRVFAKQQYRAGRLKILEYFMEHSCVSCGESNPVVLEFHHTDPSTKLGCVSNLVKTKNWEIVLEEIRKCVVLCANCHRIETAKTHGWYAKFLLPSSTLSSIEDQPSISH